MPLPPDPRPLRLAYLADPNEVHTRRWLAFFAERGHHVNLLVRADAELEGGMPEAIEVIRLAPFEVRWYRLDSYLAARRAVRRALQAVRPDVLHVHYLTGYGFLAWLSGIRPYAITVWGSDVFRTIPASRKAALYGGLALRGASLVTADSRDLADAAIRAGAHRERTIETQFGVDTAEFSPGAPNEELRARVGLAPGLPVVFAPRLLLPWMRQDVAVRAVASVPGVQLLLTGFHADPAHRRDIEQLVAELGVGERVRIVETVPHAEMAAHLRLADVVLSVPDTDGTPVTILESLATGVPVVATDVPSVREWLADVDPASLVAVGDVEATATAIRRLLDQPPAERTALVEAGRRLVIERGDHATNMLDVERRYHALARHGTARQASREALDVSR